ncbi:uncharacterized protein CBL_00234 [Carabus blaptoides fortunei]
MLSCTDAYAPRRLGIASRGYRKAIKVRNGRPVVRPSGADTASIRHNIAAAGETAAEERSPPHIHTDPATTTTTALLVVDMQRLFHYVCQCVCATPHLMDLSSVIPEDSKTVLHLSSHLMRRYHPNDQTFTVNTLQLRRVDQDKLSSYGISSLCVMIVVVVLLASTTVATCRRPALPNFTRSHRRPIISGQSAALAMTASFRWYCSPATTASFDWNQSDCQFDRRGRVLSRRRCWKKKSEDDEGVVRITSPGASAIDAYTSATTNLCPYLYWNRGDFIRVNCAMHVKLVQSSRIACMYAVAHASNLLSVEYVTVIRCIVMITDDDDDTHICLRCHTTIIGLDHYVSHRKAGGCRSQSNDHTKPRTLSPLMPPDEPDFALKADDFFSLLELQSSSKKSALQVPTTTKVNSGVLTRSKATAVIQASNPNRASDWFGGHQLRELGNEDNQTKLINAVDNISGNSIKKEEPARLNFEAELDEESNEEFDEDEEDFEEECLDAPPRSHTGGKWKPSTSPIQWLRPNQSHEERNDWNNPPPSHTGGKWKPMLPSHTRQVSEGEPDDDKNVPPPEHTKGKWIPGRNTTETNEENIPHLRKSSGTVQYWCGPCNRRLASKIVYERHLKSDLHYKRTIHEREFENASLYLNQKPTTTTQDRAEGKRKIIRPKQFCSNAEESKKMKEGDNDNEVRKGRFKKRLRCEVCRSKVVTHLMGKHLISHYHCRKRNFMKPVAERMVLDNIHSIIQQAPFQCGACRFFCNNSTQFLCHWQSSSHVTRMESSAGILQCSFCQFETAYNEIMQSHLLSNAHREVVSVINRSVPIIIKRIVPIRCPTCGKRFSFNAELRKHCLKENHVLADTSTDKYQERFACSDCNFVFKSAKSLQRHLQRRHDKNYYFCSVCSLTFNTDIGSKIHRTTQEHKYAVLTKKYGKDITRTCKHCYLRFSNVLLLKNHLQKQHPEHYFSCPQCGLKFTLSQEVTQHIKAKACNFESSPTVAYFNCEKCPYKSNSEANYLFHMALHSVPCTTYHMSNQASGTSRKRPVQRFKCPVCQKFFRKSSLRCHVRLHTNERPFKCQFCKASYARKNNLVDHIKQQHEEQYKKTVDDEEFAEKQTEDEVEQFEDPLEQGDPLATEIHQNEEADEAKLNRNRETSTGTRDKRFLCSFCGKSFLKKYTLIQHAKVHTGKDTQCPHAGCVFRARSVAELSPHLATHSDLRPFPCVHCDYRTKTKAQLVRHLKVHETETVKKFECSFCSFATRLRSHLRRHLRVHTGAKPYRCPYCGYSCNTLENLRKHILLTTKHPGKSVYECKFCDEPDHFATNLAKDFRTHLVKHHQDSFVSMKEAASYIVGIYVSEEDSKMVDAGDNLLIKDAKSKMIRKEKLAEESKPSTSQVDVVKHDPPISSTSAVLLTSYAQDTMPKPAIDNELLSMTVVSNAREDVVYVPSSGADTWTMEGLYDVEESGMLVPFHSEDGSLLAEHFDDDSH